MNRGIHKLSCLFLSFDSRLGFMLYKVHGRQSAV